MTTRKTATHINPVTVTAAALRAVKVASDYQRIGNSNPAETVIAAWEQLSQQEQQRIRTIVDSDTKPAPQAIADELAACGTKIQLESVKAEHGELAVKAAWKLLSTEERSRLTSICQTESMEEPAVYKVESESKLTKRNLIELTSDLQHLDNLLDNLNGEDIPVDIQVAVDELLAQREQTHEQLLEKLDNYAALIQSRLMWAAARKAEADRMAKLAESDTKVVDFLRSRLKEHLEATGGKKLRTKRFNIGIKTAGGKQALRLNVESPEQLPQRFQRVTVDVDNTALREALESNDLEAKDLAYLAERTTYLAIS